MGFFRQEYWKTGISMYALLQGIFLTQGWSLLDGALEGLTETQSGVSTETTEINTARCRSAKDGF